MKIIKFLKFLKKNFYKVLGIFLLFLVICLFYYLFVFKINETYMVVIPVALSGVIFTMLSLISYITCEYDSLRTKSLFLKKFYYTAYTNKIIYMDKDHLKLLLNLCDNKTEYVGIIALTISITSLLVSWISPFLEKIKNKESFFNYFYLETNTLIFVLVSIFSVLLFLSVQSIRLKHLSYKIRERLLGIEDDGL